MLAATDWPTVWVVTGLVVLMLVGVAVLSGLGED